MVMLEIAIGMVLWSVYSSIRRSRIKRTIFTTMQILSELRDPYGDRSNIPNLAANLPDYIGGDNNDKDSSSWIRLAGDDSISLEESNNNKNKNDITFKSTSNGWIVAYSDNGQKCALFGPKQAISTSLPKLDKLVAARTMMMEIVEDLDQRLAWEKEIASCQTNASSSSSASTKKRTTNTTTPAISSFSGEYHFCYRDYVNHEELMGMMWRRWGIENFLFKPSRAGLVRIVQPPPQEDEECDPKQNQVRCILSERSKLFGVVPIAIDWQGRLVRGGDDESSGGGDGGSRDTTTDLRIVWDSSSVDLGWGGKGSLFGKHFDRPAVAEKLRQAPWVIKVKKDKIEIDEKQEEEEKSDDGHCTKETEESFSTDIVCFEMIGKGHLVFAKKGRMATGAATVESRSTSGIVHSLRATIQACRMLMYSGVPPKMRAN